MSVAVGTVLKKIAEAVAASKKGRKAIGYTDWHRDLSSAFTDDCYHRIVRLDEQERR